MHDLQKHGRHERAERNYGVTISRKRVRPAENKQIRADARGASGKAA